MFDAVDARAQARFWSRALDWRSVVTDPSTERVHVASEVAGEPGLAFAQVRDPKVGKNRVHLDLVGGPERTQRQMVDHLLALGASRADIGQGMVPWEVLADPEGNELCVLTDGNAPRPLAAICLDAADPGLLGGFWAAALGWPVETERDGVVVLRSRSPAGPALVLGPPVAPKRAKNRLHFDVAPRPGDDPQNEVERLLGAGAARVDVGQRGTAWDVLADPEGNEFCLLFRG